jgi:hypothetical protein
VRREVDILANEHAICLALAAGVHLWQMSLIRRDR